MKPQHLVDQAAKAGGGMAKMADALNVSLQTAWNWRTRGVPIAYCASVEKFSGFVVRRWDLRPDDWHRIWPELVGQEGAPAVPAVAAPAAEAA